MKLKELIDKNYHDLSDTERIIAQFIINNLQKVPAMPISDVAANSHSSKSAVVRLSKKLGFNGFTEMKTFLKWEEDNHIDQYKLASRKLLISSIEKTLEYIKTADWTGIYKLIDVCEKIFVLTTGVSQKNQSFELQRLFLYTGKPVTTIPAYSHDDEFKHFFNVLEPKDLVLIISLSGENPHLSSVLNLLTLKRSKIISLTNYTSNMLAKRADYQLYAISLRKENDTEYYLQSNSAFFLTLEALVFGYLDYTQSGRQK